MGPAVLDLLCFDGVASYDWALGLLLKDAIPNSRLKGPRIIHLQHLGTCEASPGCTMWSALADGP